MPEIEPVKMPWRGIGKATAIAAGVVGSFSTWLCWIEKRAEEERRRDALRPRWTDAARWEK